MAQAGLTETPGNFGPRAASASSCASWFTETETAGQARLLLWLPGLLLLAALAVLPVDASLARWCAEAKWPAAFQRLLLLTEGFGHAIGILIIGLLVFQLDLLRRWAVPRLAFTAIGAGVLADTLKLLVDRARPMDGQLAPCAWDMVAGVVAPGVPLLSPQSFPSGHAAAAVALAIVLSRLYPRAITAFAGLALLASVQRLVEGSHYLTDVLVGAAIGALVAIVCVDKGPLAALFARREAAWRGIRGLGD